MIEVKIDEPSDLTFVTCFVKLYENGVYKNTEWRIEMFRLMLSSGIKIVCYGCDQTIHTLNELEKEFSNLKVLELDVPYQKTSIYELCQQFKHSLPAIRTDYKDTIEYLTLMNCKTVFMNDAIKKNYWGSNTFAWIDFSIWGVFTEKMNKNMHELSKKKFVNKFLAFPGCWNRIEEGAVYDSIYWRFCGGFFIGDKNSITDFHELYIKYFPVFVEKYGKIAWEINFWTWLETNNYFQPIWYYSDHNDGIIKIPEFLYIS
jgi:hypothetical protein